MYRLLTPMRSVTARTARLASRACPPHVQRILPASLSFASSSSSSVVASSSSSLASNSRSFSTNEEDRRPTAAEARAALARSLAEDIDSQTTDPDEWTASYLTETKFQVKLPSNNTDSDGVLATRTVEGHVVRVTFRAFEYEESQEEETDQEHEVEHATEFQQLFTVEITNPAGKILRLTFCNARDGELEFMDFGFPVSVKADPTLTVAESDFTNPSKDGDVIMTSFNELSEEAGNNLIDYCESVGVDDDLALFVANQAQLVRTMKHQRELSKLKSFVQ